ncbi:Poly (ADP-ribose) polymerase [Desmophyllum pertusum]|uniref:Poly (ADP-ribose) polymerase n=1 Tax=Desmophyllum pertusum TaxID=174260 RepID=A0A9W9YEJ6_9CNID|nr:Poly (ADP-ribose) polymerase [Desmophyllum pertusum]
MYHDSRCPRLHICKDFVVNACKNGDSCRFQHKWAFDTHHTRSLLEKYRLGKMSQDNVWKTILVCEEQVNGPYSGKSMKCPGAASLSGLSTENTTSEDLTERWVMDSGPKETQVSRNMSSSQPRKAVQERRPSVSSSCSSVAVCDKFSPSKKVVFACICKEYNGSVSFAVISKRQDLFPEDSENIATWFRTGRRVFVSWKEQTEPSWRSARFVDEQDFASTTLL